MQAEANVVSVRMGMGDGSFGDAQEIGVGEQPLGVWGGDLNNDGAPELAVANRGAIGDTSGTVSLLVGFGDGTFADPAFLTTDLDPRSLTGDQDFDGDGKQGSGRGDFGSDSISLLLASGPAQYDDGHTSLPVALAPWRSGVAT